MDKVDQATRSRIMAAVGQKDTGPEKHLRSALHKHGLRFRLHVRSLPGSPDLVFPKYGSVIFVHGCYWHRHGCYRSTTPKSRQEFWNTKFKAIKRATGATSLGWVALVGVFLLFGNALWLARRLVIQTTFQKKSFLG